MRGLLWVVAAVVVGLLAMVLMTRARLRRRLEPPPPVEALPRTPLQHLALRSLVIGLLLAVAAGAWVAVVGPVGAVGDARVRIGITALLVGSLAVLAVAAAVARRWARSGVLDEREQAILDRAPLVEGVPMIVTLACWLIGLQEAYWDAGQVPVAYLFLIFWSVVLVKMLALPVGILLGSRWR